MVKNKVAQDPDQQDKKSHCLACDNELKNHRILVCVECLGQDCDKFLKMALSLQGLEAEEHIE